MGKPIISMLFLLLSINVMAQEKSNAFSLQYGVGYIARQDLVFSPFVHKSTTPLHVGLGYVRRAKWQQEFNLQFASFSTALTTAYPYRLNDKNEQTYPHNFTLIDFDYALGKPISSSWSVGLQANTDVQALSYSYGRVSGSFGYFANFGLGVYLEKSHTIGNRHCIGGKISLPVVNWLTRSPYLVNNDEFIENTSSHNGLKTFWAFIEDGRLSSLEQFQSLDLLLKYTYHLSSRWALGGVYGFEFTHSSHPRNLLQYRHTLYLSTTLNF
jgi:hypothetical protein